MNINATGTFDAEKGTFTLEMDLEGHTEMEHEMLAAFFADKRSVIVFPTHEGDVLSASFVIADHDAFDLAVHNLENRKRAQDGRPSLEQEAAASAAQVAAQHLAQANAKANAEAAAKEQQESRDRIEKLAAQEIADRTLAAKLPPAPAPRPAETAAPAAAEPKKVQ